MCLLKLEVMRFALCFVYECSPCTFVFEESYGARQWNVVVRLYLMEGVVLLGGVTFSRMYITVGMGFGVLTSAEETLL